MTRPRRPAAALALLVLLGAASPALGAASDLDEAREALAAKEFSRAEGRLRAWLAEHPADAEARWMLARVLSWQGKRADALVEFDRLLAGEPGNADYLVGKAFVLWWEARLAEARAALERALARAPAYEDAHRLLVRVLRAQGDEAALAAAREAIARRFPGREREVAEGPFQADEGSPESRRRVEAEAGFARDGLTGGRDSWTSEYGEVLLQYGRFEGPSPDANRRLAWLRVRRTERFSRLDEDLLAGLSFPLSLAWTGTIEGAVSPTHRVLPRWTASAEVRRDLGRGWGASLGAKRSEYGDASTAATALGVEKYFGDLRAAYSFTRSHLFGDGDASTHGLSLRWYYGARGWSFVGAGASFGREIENAAGTGVVRTDVRAWTLSGRHWFNDRWAATWEVGLADQGSLYTRRGFLVGLRYRF